MFFRASCRGQTVHGLFTNNSTSSSSSNSSCTLSPQGEGMRVPTPKQQTPWSQAVCRLRVRTAQRKAVLHMPMLQRRLTIFTITIIISTSRIFKIPKAKATRVSGACCCCNSGSASTCCSRTIACTAPGTSARPIAPPRVQVLWRMRCEVKARGQPHSGIGRLRVCLCVLLVCVCFCLVCFACVAPS